MAGDVIDVILQDHREFEELLHDVRNAEADRMKALSELSALLVAHAEAEERKVYPKLRRRDAVSAEEVEHSEEEHAEGHEALLAVLELGDPDSNEFGDAVERLTKELAHHLDEEERTVLNPARTEVDEDMRHELGKAFVKERRRQLESDCGSIENVRRVVERAKSRHKI